jgi:hypothetical protein
VRSTFHSVGRENLRLACGRFESFPFGCLSQTPDSCRTGLFSIRSPFLDFFSCPMSKAPDPRGSSAGPRGNLEKSRLGKPENASFVTFPRVWNYRRVLSRKRTGKCLSSPPKASQILASSSVLNKDPESILVGGKDGLIANMQTQNPQFRESNLSITHSLFLERNLRVQHLTHTIILPLQKHPATTAMSSFWPRFVGTLFGRLLDL